MFIPPAVDPDPTSGSPLGPLAGRPYGPYNTWMSPRRYGAEDARAHLPELLERARRGTATLITKRGRPCAVLMPVEQARAAGRHVELMSLAGTGAGLWGGDSARMVREMRRPHAAGR